MGCNNFGMRIDTEQTAKVVHAALDLGVTHFDTAEMYGEGRSEVFLGQALKGRRDEAVLATKFLPRSGETFSSGDLAARITESVEQSLRSLQTDRIDVYYQHYFDVDAPLDELLDTLDGLVTSGKVLHVALSNLHVGQLKSVMSAPRELPLRAVQIEWNVLNRAVEETLVPASASAGLGVVPYFPLAAGLLTGKYRGMKEYPADSRFGAIPYFAQVASEENLTRVENLAAVAERHGRTLSELAFGWLLAQGQVASVIAGATSPEQVTANAAAVGWDMTPAELAEVETALTV
nr:aldo/keto reductase [Kineosporia babensis]